jgi:hypothetical protein
MAAKRLEGALRPEDPVHPSFEHTLFYIRHRWLVTKTPAIGETPRDIV